ncbi:MAG TPA: ATP synthase F0 subunit B [Terriglobales bacterium]|jgi:F-type H+-transporting ATPase subunit b
MQTFLKCRAQVLGLAACLVVALIAAQPVIARPSFAQQAAEPSAQPQAQSQPSSSANSASGTSTASPDSNANSGGNRQLVEMSRQAAGEAANSNDNSKEAEKDETAEFKQSPAVQWLAKVTGLKVRQAYWMGVLLNFGVLAAVILWFSAKGLPKMFRNRTASIQQAMAEARKASEEARRRLADIEARLNRLDGEIGKMKTAAENEAAQEEERIKAATTEDVRKVVESAEQEIASAAKAARRELTRHAADLAISLAEKQINVDPATDQQLVRGFSDQLSNGSGSKQ